MLWRGISARTAMIEWQGVPSISLRLLDANLNRASEGLRVLEDLARFAINDEALSRELKTARHELARLAQPLDIRLLSWRDSAADVGRESTLRAGVPERDLLAVVRANAKRAEESLRVIEELARLPELAACINPGMIERLRYTTYDIEKRLAGRVLRRERAATLRGLYVIVDREVSRGRALNDVAREAIAGGASVIQLRDKVGGRGEVYREAGEEAEQKHDEISAALRAELARWETPEGIVMESSSWVISARNPG